LDSNPRRIVDRTPMRATTATRDAGVDRATHATNATRRAMRRGGARALARTLERIRLTPRRRGAWTRGVADGEGARARERASVATSDALDARAVVVRERSARRDATRREGSKF